VKARVTAIDGMVDAVGAGAGLGGNFIAAFGAGLEHGENSFHVTKKCAAEATHRKMHGSHCCDTTFEQSLEDAKMEYAFLPIVKIHPQKGFYSVVSQVHYSTKPGKSKEVFEICFFKWYCR
jgi:hypothetical protein